MDDFDDDQPAGLAMTAQNGFACVRFVSARVGANMRAASHTQTHTYRPMPIKREKKAKAPRAVRQS